MVARGLHVRYTCRTVRSVRCTVRRCVQRAVAAPALRRIALVLATLGVGCEERRPVDSSELVMQTNIH